MCIPVYDGREYRAECTPNAPGGTTAKIVPPIKRRSIAGE
jgi:hypothetical protein